MDGKSRRRRAGEAAHDGAQVRRFPGAIDAPVAVDECLVPLAQVRAPTDVNRSEIPLRAPQIKPGERRAGDRFDRDDRGSLAIGGMDGFDSRQALIVGNRFAQRLVLVGKETRLEPRPRRGLTERQRPDQDGVAAALGG